MRHLILILTLALLPSFVGAQSATINSPISEAKIIVEQVDVTRGQGGYVRVSVQTSTDQTKRFLQFDIAQSELTSFITAQMTVLDAATQPSVVPSQCPAETGGNARKMNLRVLCWLKINNKVVDSNGDAIAVTLVP